LKRFVCFLFFFCVLLPFSAACSDRAGHSKGSNEGYTVAHATKDGHVVIEHLSNQFDEVTQGAVKTKNLEKAFAFTEAIKNGQESQLKVTIFNKNGKSYTNDLSYDGNTIEFNNHYGGYRLPPGKYQCETLTPRNDIFYLEPCTDEKGQKISTVIAIISDSQSFQDAEQKVGTK
jgi:hypothetical protein